MGQRCQISNFTHWFEHELGKESGARTWRLQSLGRPIRWLTLDDRTRPSGLSRMLVYRLSFLMEGSVFRFSRVFGNGNRASVAETARWRVARGGDVDCHQTVNMDCRRN